MKNVNGCNDPEAGSERYMCIAVTCLPVPVLNYSLPNARPECNRSCAESRCWLGVTLQSLSCAGR